MTADDSRGPDGWVPVPDPTKLTDAAIERATAAYRRELDALRTLLAERIQTEIEARDQAVGGLRDVWSALHDVLGQRVTDQSAALDRHLAHVDEISDRIRKDQHAELVSLRENIDVRLTAMDTATELVARDMQRVPSVMEERLTGLRELIGERIDAIDRATTLKLTETAKLPGEVKDQIARLQELHEERFKSIGTQFTERDIRTDQASKAAKEALDAALQAAKELVNAQGEASAAAAVKSETSFTKQIDQIGTIISTLEKALDARITELKERIDRGEGSASGVTSVAGSPYDAAVLRQAEQQAQAAAEQARAAQARAVMALAISGLLVLITLASVIFAITKK